MFRVLSLPISDSKPDSLKGYKTGGGLKLANKVCDVLRKTSLDFHPRPDTPAMATSALINIRGRSSREFDKKSYRITLIYDDGINNNQPVMGMHAHHEWVLHGPFLDKSLIRN